MGCSPATIARGWRKILLLETEPHLRSAQKSWGLVFVGGPLCLCHPQRAFLASPLGGPGRSEACLSATALPAWEPLVAVLVGDEEAPPPPDSTSAVICPAVGIKLGILLPAPAGSLTERVHADTRQLVGQAPSWGQRPGSHHCDLSSKISQKGVVLSP